jgi:hypothetical protein
MNAAFSYPRDSLGAECPSSSVDEDARQTCGTALTNAVGDSLARIAADALDDTAFERHIADLTNRWMAHYASFQETGDLAARDKALALLRCRDRMLLERARIKRAQFGATGGSTALRRHRGVLPERACDRAGERRPVNRVRYLVRFAYWAVRHRSLSNAAWVCAYEGVHW